MHLQVCVVETAAKGLGCTLLTLLSHCNDRLSPNYGSGDENYETFTLRKVPRIRPSRLYRVSSFGAPCPADDHRSGRLRRLHAAEAWRPPKNHRGRPAGAESI